MSEDPSGFVTSVLGTLLASPVIDVCVAGSSLLGAVNIGSTCYWAGASHHDSGPYRVFAVGNNAYQHLPPLYKCTNDAMALSSTLRDIGGYLSHVGLNTTRWDFVSSFEAFCRSLIGAETVVFFFAGHGFRPSGTSESFLAMTDADREYDVDGQWSCRLPA